MVYFSALAICYALSVNCLLQSEFKLKKDKKLEVDNYPHNNYTYKMGCTYTFHAPPLCTAGLHNIMDYANPDFSISLGKGFPQFLLFKQCMQCTNCIELHIVYLLKAEFRSKHEYTAGMLLLDTEHEYPNLQKHQQKIISKVNSRANSWYNALTNTYSVISTINKHGKQLNITKTANVNLKAIGLSFGIMERIETYAIVIF